MAQSKQTVGFPFVRDTFWSGDMWCQALSLTSDMLRPPLLLLRTLQTLHPSPSCSSCLGSRREHPFCSQAKQALLSLRPSTQCCTVTTFLNRHLPACQLASVACCSAAQPESQGSHHICGSLESQSCSFIQNQANGYPVTFLVTGALQMW